MNKTITFQRFLFFLLISVSHTYGQTVTQPKYWLSGGVGKAQLPSAMIAAGYEFSQIPTVFTARYSVSGELVPMVEPGIKVSEIGLLYGLRIGNFRLSAGLSRVWGNNRGRYLFSTPDPLMGTGQTYEFVPYQTIGVPAEIRYIASLKHVGIGITGFGNLNAKRSFAGLNVSLYVGRLK